MADTPGDGWDDREKEALLGLGSAPVAPASLEEAVAGRLRREGFLAGRRALRAALGALAAGLTLFALGYALGGRPPASPGPRFVLFLHDTPASAVTTEAGTQERVREYTAWAQQQRGAGRPVTGAKLADDAVVLEGALPPVVRREEVGETGGYFVIAAPDLAQALAVASTCPHLRHGGRIVVRPVDG